MSSITPQRREKTAGETVAVTIDVRGYLDSGETATGTPTIVEVTTSDLTITSKTVNASSVVVNGVTLTAGQALQCLVAGGTPGETYQIKAAFGTSASQTRIVNILIDVIADTA